MKNPGYFCPVCGFRGLKEVPYDEHGAPSYEICPCCGFEFGFDGFNNSIAYVDFRQRWIKNGARWFIPGLKPEGWDLGNQLSNLNKDKPATA